MDLLCFSHLRWDFVFQRPQHLLTRAAETHRVFFIEEPLHDAGISRMAETDFDGVTVVTPWVVEIDVPAETAILTSLLAGWMSRRRIVMPIVWYYTPMALPWSHQVHASASAVIYDCMDDLSAFDGAPVGMVPLEHKLLASADLVFTGGASLHEAREQQHRAAHCFPSSVDVAHFAAARGHLKEREDQAAIPRPRVGYFGVLDERLDWALVAAIAARRPAVHLVLVGPTAKVDPATLPTAPNIHYLGSKAYAELPAYLSGWDVAMMPFAHNRATRYISPTKTPEYLAGGVPVALTSIRDVVHPYGDLGLVHVGDGVDGFLGAIDAALSQDRRALAAKADSFLDGRSWASTWACMSALIEGVISDRQQARHAASVFRPGPRPALDTPVAAGRGLAE